MAHIKCPRCELNYMLDSEELCDVCKREVGYILPEKYRNTECIYEYICRIYKDFQEYLNEANSLCNLKSFTFEGGDFPDYTDIHVQQLYVLRYSYAYAYEYKLMFNHLFKNYDVGTDISVTSVGCGNMIDYWSLVEALHDKKKYKSEIKYIGLDVIDWEHKIKSREIDTVTFKQSNAKDHFNGIDKLDSDIYIFPMSISEFSDEEFCRLCECFQNKPIKNDKFCVLIPMRVNKQMLQNGNAVDAVRSDDIFRADLLKKHIIQNGFLADDFSMDEHSCFSVNVAISILDLRFRYPDIQEQLKNLNDQCKMKDSACGTCNKMNRSPMLTTGNVAYSIFIFRRA